MMEIYEYLEGDNTTMTLDYKHGVTISNRIVKTIDVLSKKKYLI